MFKIMELTSNDYRAISEKILRVQIMLSTAKVMKLSQSSASLRLMVTKKMAMMAPVLLFLHRKISV